MDNKLTDNEIIKAFECCNNDGCENCPNRPTCCEIDVADEILNIINRQKAEIERLKVELYKLRATYDCELSYRKELHKRAKTEAYKEIVKKLKEHLCSYDLPNYFSFEAVDEDTIDEVLKELVGENNG